MMYKTLFTVAIILGTVSCATAQSRYYYDDYDYRSDESYRRERTAAKVERERLESVRAQQEAERERIYTHRYGSDAGRNDSKNSLDTLNQITNAVAEMAGTAQYIKNVFGN